MSVETNLTVNGQPFLPFESVTQKPADRNKEDEKWVMERGDR